MVAKVEIGARMDSLHLFESERKFVFDVGRGIGIVGQLVVVVETVVLVAETERAVPTHARRLPLFEPLEFLAGTHEKLHLHLLELAHTKNELPSDDLVAERLADLCDPERNFHPAGLLHVQEIDENTLCRFGPQVDRVGALADRPHLRFEHQVELAHFRPIARTGDRTNDLAIDDDLAQFFQVVVVQRGDHPAVHGVAFGLVFDYARVRLEKFRLVERFAETLTGLFDLFGDLLVLFGDEILDQHVGAVTLLRIAIVDQRIVERPDMSRRFPYLRVHEDRRVDPDDIVVQPHHRLPPVTLDVVFQLHALLSVIVYGAQTVVYFARRENKPVLLAVSNQLFKKFFLCHYRKWIIFSSVYSACFSTRQSDPSAFSSTRKKRGRSSGGTFGRWMLSNSSPSNVRNNIPCPPSRAKSASGICNHGPATSPLCERATPIAYPRSPNDDHSISSSPFRFRYRNGPSVT